MTRALASLHTAGAVAPVAPSEVAVVLDFVGASAPQFDQLMSRLGFESRGPGLPGSLFQWVRETDVGVRVTQVWASREDFDACAHDRILPAAAELRIPPPETTVYQVHSHLMQGSTHREENGDGRSQKRDAE